MGVLTAVCWGMFIFIAGAVDPTTTNWLGFLLFYCALFLALAGTAAIIGFWFRFAVFKKDLAFNLVKKSFRQSFFLALFVIFALILKSQSMLTLLNAALLITFFTILELFLLSYKQVR